MGLLKIRYGVSKVRLVVAVNTLLFGLAWQFRRDKERRGVVGWRLLWYYLAVESCSDLFRLSMVGSGALVFGVAVMLSCGQQGPVAFGYVQIRHGPAVTFGCGDLR